MLFIEASLTIRTFLDLLVAKLTKRLASARKQQQMILLSTFFALYLQRVKHVVNVCYLQRSLRIF